MGSAFTQYRKGSNQIVRNEVPGGSVNGSNTAFTTSSGFVADSLTVYVNGVRQKGSANDFTATDGGFTMVTPPETGDLLLVDYSSTATVEAGDILLDEADSVGGDNIASYNIIHENRGSPIANVNDIILKSGFARATGSGTSNTATSQSFDTAFPNEVLAVICTGAGKRPIADGTMDDITYPDEAAASIVLTTDNVTTSGFNVNLHHDAGSAMSSSYYWAYSWFAIGR